MIKKRIYKSIFFRFIISFLLVAILPWTMVSAIVFYRFSRNQKEIIMQNYQQSLSGVLDNIDKTYLDIINILHSVDINYILNEPDVKNTLRYYLNQSNVIENVIFIDGNGEAEIMSKSNKYQNVFFDFTSEEYFAELQNSSGEILTTGIHGQPYFNGVNEYVISFMKKYYHSGSYAGMIMLDLNVNYFIELYKKYDFERIDSLQIVMNDICIYSSNYREIDTKIEVDDIVIFETSNSYIDAFKSGNEFYLHTVSDIAHVEIFLRLNPIKIFSNLYNMERFLWFVALFSIIGTICLAALFSFFMYKPIQKLIRKMKKIEMGDFEVKDSRYRDDEIGMISSSLDNMVECLKKYIEKEYFYQIKQNQSKFDALRMQIKPHYIYNVLEVIRVTAREENAKKTCAMILSLAKQLRYLLDDSSAFVKLKDEFDNVKQYIELTRPRYENFINVIYQIEEAVVECYVPKITLQPIVENIFKHAIVKPDMEIKIVICACDVNNHIEIEIFDNGCGIEQEKVDNILKHDFESNHIGLKNINDRIQLLFGSEYGVKIQSELEVGTLIKIILPKNKEEWQG